jgi:hypothetical protein
MQGLSSRRKLSIPWAHKDGGLQRVVGVEMPNPTAIKAQAVQGQDIFAMRRPMRFMHCVPDTGAPPH